jgi:hypothetical protein
MENKGFAINMLVTGPKEPVLGQKSPYWGSEYVVTYMTALEHHVKLVITL